MEETKEKRLAIRPPLAEKKLCIHCDSLLPLKAVQDGENAFCCYGCLIAYKAVKESGLEFFYDIRKDYLDQFAPAKEKKTELSYLDEERIRKKFEISPNTIDFYVQGIQCAACSWLLEKAAQEMEEVVQIRVHAINHSLRLELKKGEDFSLVSSRLMRFGYILHPIALDANTDEWKENQRLSEIKRIAVAGVCAGNIMLLSFADYFGATENFATKFRWLSFFLILPILFYSAFPILKTSFLSLKNKRPSLDLPISVAFLSGLGLSFYSLLISSQMVYFDSIAVLIFLILSSRYWVRRYKDAFYEKIHQNQEIFSQVVKKKAESGDFSFTTLDEVKEEDVLLFEESSNLSVDGYIVDGSAWLNEAAFSGESTRRFISKGAKVFAGSIVEKGAIEVSVEKKDSETRIGKLLKKSNINALYKKQAHTAEEKFAHFFTWFSLSLAAFTFFYYWPDMMVAFERSLSLLIVACPCVVAFGSPLIYARLIQKLNHYGIFIKDVQSLTKIQSIKEIVFDKTGTITKGSFRLKECYFESDKDKRAILSLEKESQHPVARAIINYFYEENIYDEIKSFRTLPSRGIEGKIGNHTYQAISENQDSSQLKIIFLKDDKKIGEAFLEDEYRDDAGSLTKVFSGLKLSILSGDQEFLVKRAAKYTGIKNFAFSKSPEEKEEILAKKTFAMMVGDGINDTAALAKADIAVILGGAIEKAFRFADIFLYETNLANLKKIWILAKINQRSHRTIFTFSIIYNLLTASLAFLGYIHPLLAAILMPISSFSIFLIVHFTTREKVWKYSI